MHSIKPMLCSNIRHASGREFPVMLPPIHGLVDLISCAQSIGRPTSSPTISRTRWRPPKWIWWPVTMNKNLLIQLLNKATTKLFSPCWYPTANIVDKIEWTGLQRFTISNLIRWLRSSAAMFSSNPENFLEEIIFNNQAATQNYFKEFSGSKIREFYFTRIVVFIGANKASNLMIFFFLFDKYTFSEIYCFQVDFKLLKTEIIFCIALTYQCLYLHHHYWKRTAWLLQDTLLKWRFWPRWVLKIQTNTNMTENIYQLGRKTIFIFLFFCSIGDHFNCFCFLQFVL